MKVPPARICVPPEDRQLILQQIDECLASGQLTLGKHGKALEAKFADYVGLRHAAAVNSGTSAIEIPLRIFDVAGKDVLVPTNTFFATPAAVVHAGGRARFLDTEPRTFSVTVKEIERRLTPNTACVIVVHIGGLVTPEMPAIRDLCRSRGLVLFEDAAHAHGSSVDGRMAGTFGQAASFSFYPTKVITSGEGGIVVTGDEKIHEEVLIYRDQGKAGFLTNFHTRLGYNWRMSEPHAIIGLSQLNRLDEFISDRQKIARLYDDGLRGISGVTAVPVADNARCNYYKYLALLDKGIDRARLKQVLREQYDVGLSGEVYDTPCHLQPIFEAYRDGDFPIAEDICVRHICLPVYARMSEAEAEHVLVSLKAALAGLH